MPENKKNVKKARGESPEVFWLVFVVNGVTVRITESVGTGSQPVESLPLDTMVAGALLLSENMGRPVADWVARTEAGAELDTAKTPKELGLEKGARILLALNAASGDGPPGFFLRFTVGREPVFIGQAPEACDTATPAENAPLYTLAEAALREEGEEGKLGLDWLAADEKGRLLDPVCSATELGLARGALVTLSRAASSQAEPDAGAPGPSSSTAPEVEASPSSVASMPPHVVPVPEWLEVQILPRGGWVSVKLDIPVGFSGRTGPGLQPFQIQCDKCTRTYSWDALNAPGGIGEEIPLLDREHPGCGGTWRACYRILLNSRRRAVLVEGTTGRTRPEGTRAELVTDAANDATDLVGTLQDLARQSRDEGHDDTAAVYERLEEDLRPVATILDEISEHLRKVGAGIPPMLAEFLAPMVEVAVSEGTAEELSAGLKVPPPSLDSLAAGLGVKPDFLRELGERVKESGGPAGALWVAAEDAARLAHSLQRAAESSAGHTLAADALLPERLALFAAQVRQALLLLKLARRLVVTDPGAAFPEDLRGPLLHPPVLGRLAVLVPSDVGRCRRCSAPLTASDGLPDAPAPVCSGCRAPEESCRCVTIDVEKERALAGELDAAAVLLSSVGDLVRRSLPSAGSLPAGDPVRLALEALPERVDRLTLHVGRIVGMLPGKEEPAAAADAPPTLPGALLEVELSAGELRNAAAAASARLPSSGEAFDYNPVRLVLQAMAERAALEAYAAAVVRKVVPEALGGAGGWASYGGDLDRIVNATRDGDAPLGFSSVVERPGGDLVAALWVLRRRAAELAVLASKALASSKDDPRAKAWKLPEVLGALLSDCERMAQNFRTLAMFAKLPERAEPPPLFKTFAVEKVAPQLLEVPPSAAAPEDAETLRELVKLEGCTLEGWSPSEGVWEAWFSRDSLPSSRVWFSAPTGAELLAQLRWFVGILHRGERGAE